MADTATMTFGDGRGGKITREVNLSIDIQKFVGQAGYPWLVIAANPHLSTGYLIEWLCSQDINAVRSETWIKKRRWMFHPKFRPGGKRNADGKDQRAILLMAEYTDLSLRDLRKVLAENGINRGKDWIRLNRCGK
jgi:hypothetical protein